MKTCQWSWWTVTALAVLVAGLTVGAGCPGVNLGPEPLTLTATATPSTGTGTTTVALAATITGGTAPYTIAWTANPSVAITNSTSANASATVTATTIFTVQVTDSATPAASATVTAQVTIGASGPVGNAAAGQTLYSQRCAGCHPQPATRNPSLVTNNMGTVNQAMTGITLTNQQVLDLKAYLNSL